MGNFTLSFQIPKFQCFPHNFPEGGVGAGKPTKVRTSLPTSRALRERLPAAVGRGRNGSCAADVMLPSRESDSRLRTRQSGPLSQRRRRCTAGPGGFWAARAPDKKLRIRRPTLLFVSLPAFACGVSPPCRGHTTALWAPPHLLLPYVQFPSKKRIF